MQYVVLIAILAVIELCYYRLAQHVGIGAPVCSRSLHTSVTPTAGGIVLLAATLIFTGTHLHSLSSEWIMLLSGALIIGIVSFIDDLRPLSAKVRLIIQIITIALIFKQFTNNSSIFAYCTYLFCAIGCVNAYNFIDGIRGILVMYATVVICSLIYAANYYIPDPTLYVALGCALICAIAVLAAFNLPNKMFSGDVGSITIGLFIAWMLLNLIHTTGDFSFFALSIVCIFDTGMTAIHRLFKGENILKPHRKNIYQTLTLNWKMPQLAVAATYALTQLSISTAYFILPEQYRAIYSLCVIVALTITYIAIRKSPRSGKF